MLMVYRTGAGLSILRTGEINQEGKLEDGKEEGLWKYFDEEGTQTYEGEWKDGVEVGQWYFFKKGTKRKWKKF